MSYSQGMMCWADLMTTDITGAASFYEHLLGWTAHEQETPMGPYTMFMLDGQPICGGGGGAGAEGQPPAHWGVYIAVDDVDAMVEVAQKAGATVHLAPMDVMEHGRMATIADPTGATINLWEARTHPGAGLSGQPGTMAWAELASWERDDAVAFYEGLLGYHAERQDMGPTIGEYVSFMVDDVPVAGALQMNEEWGEMPSHWSIYWGVRDIEEAVATVRAQGGTVHSDIIAVPEVGRFAVVSDPQGVAFYAMQMDHYAEAA